MKIQTAIIKYKNKVDHVSQWAIIFYMLEHKTATRKQISNDLNTSPENLSQMIKPLIQKSIIKSIGNTRNQYYTLN